MIQDTSPHKRSWRPGRAVRVYIYSFFNLVARWGACKRQGPVVVSPGMGTVPIAQEDGWEPGPLWTSGLIWTVIPEFAWRTKEKKKKKIVTHYIRFLGAILEQEACRIRGISMQSIEPCVITFRCWRCKIVYKDCYSPSNIEGNLVKTRKPKPTKILVRSLFTSLLFE